MRSLMELLKEEEKAINGVVRIDEMERRMHETLNDIYANPHEGMAKENDIERCNAELCALFHDRTAAEAHLNDVRRDLQSRLRQIVNGDSVGCDF